MKQLLFLFFCFVFSLQSMAQFNWKKNNSGMYNSNETDTVWRSGSVAISHAFTSPYSSRLMVTGKYDTLTSKGLYVSLNEPRYDLLATLPLPLDTATVGMATQPTSNYQVGVFNNYANFQAGKVFSDVHNSSLEVGFTRGFSEQMGFRDGGRLQRGFTSKFSASFGNNSRNYQTDNFDIINLRLFTGNEVGNTATVGNFYAIRMENFRGPNAAIIQNGWGIYMQPVQLKNYFGGAVGIGTTTVTNALTVAAAADPLKIMGVQNGATDEHLLTIDNEGVVHKNLVKNLPKTFLNTTTNTVLTDDYQIYIHKGGDAVYTLPPPATRTGKSWKIVNIGSGTLTLSVAFYEGSTVRTTILHESGGHSFELFSDGMVYISL